MVGVTTGELAPPSDGPWPGVDRPAGLLKEIADWLGGYGNRATRRTYAEGLGLPVTAADIRDWLPPADEIAKTMRVSNSWPAAVTHYATVVGATSTGETGEASQHRPPPATRGRFRHLHWFRWCASSGVDPLTATST